MIGVHISLNWDNGDSDVSGWSNAYNKYCLLGWASLPKKIYSLLSSGVKGDDFCAIVPSDCKYIQVSVEVE